MSMPRGPARIETAAIRDEVRDYTIYLGHSAGWSFEKIADLVQEPVAQVRATLNALKPGWQDPLVSAERVECEDRLAEMASPLVLAAWRRLYRQKEGEDPLEIAGRLFTREGLSYDETIVKRFGEALKRTECAKRMLTVHRLFPRVPQDELVLVYELWCAALEGQDAFRSRIPELMAIAPDHLRGEILGHHARKNNGRSR